MAQEWNTQQALSFLARESYCLWAGAGVSTQLGLAGGASIHGWDGLVSALEQRAELQPPALFDAELPDRIDACFVELQREKFQRALREEVLIPLAGSIVNAAQISGVVVPTQVRQLAHLAAIANPIVNFNIETLSSRALVGAFPPWKPLVFRPPVPDAVESWRCDPESGDRQKIRRHVFHPHGVLDISGVCILGARDYRAMRGTLALQLAVHSAFELNLAIVGMSLNDAYLRAQLADFRPQVREVLWFTSSPLKVELAEWAWKNHVRVVSVDWPDFWETVQRELPAPPEQSLWHNWCSLVNEAYAIPKNPTSESVNGLMRVFEKRPEELASWIWSAKLMGEDVILGQERTPTSKEESEWVRMYLKEIHRQLQEPQSQPPPIGTAKPTK